MCLAARSKMACHQETYISHVPLDLISPPIRSIHKSRIRKQIDQFECLRDAMEYVLHLAS